MKPRYGLAIAIALVGCGPTSPGGGNDGVDGGTGGGADARRPGGGDAREPTERSDFPADPIIDVGVPPTAPDLFEPPGSDTGGPCLIEPEAGTLFPLDWNRPRVSFVPADGQNLFEIRMHADRQVNDLRVYTTATTWTMPAPIWSALNERFSNQRVTVTVRGARLVDGRLAGPPAGGPAGSFAIAPAPASGSIVYWTTSTADDGTSAFKGFRVGDETIQAVLAPPQASASCVGCHSSTPDGEYVAFSAAPVGGDGGSSHVELRSLDGRATRPPWLSAAALQLLGREGTQQPVFSQAHWRDGDRVVLSMYDGLDTGTGIIWTDLAATSTAEGVGWGVVTRTGDDQSAAAVAFSRAGTMVAYTSASGVSSGVNVDSGGDIYVAPYNDRAGGQARPLRGASEAGITEHYAAFSADDTMVAFTRVRGVTAYDTPGSEIYVVPSEGGDAVRLAANDPPACGGRTSPGVTNSWPKWSPDVYTEDGTRYYWLTFSSRRSESRRPQLYVTGVSIDAAGAVTTYPAIYVWHQPSEENNHTPAWDNFGIIVD